MASFLPYYVARHAALDLDREGRAPGVLVRLLAGIASLAALGLAACVALALGWTGLAMLGIVH